VEAERGEKPRIRQKAAAASRHTDWLTANKSASQPTSRSKSSKSSIERPSAVRIKGPSEVESAPRNVTAATRDHRFKLPRRREAKCSALKYYRTCGFESSLPPEGPSPTASDSPESGGIAAEMQPGSGRDFRSGCTLGFSLLSLSGRVSAVLSLGNRTVNFPPTLARMWGLIAVGWLVMSQILVVSQGLPVYPTVRIGMGEP
jgi:hypothetical protein